MTTLHKTVSSECNSPAIRAHVSNGNAITNGDAATNRTASKTLREGSNADYGLATDDDDSDDEPPPKHGNAAFLQPRRVS